MSGLFQYNESFQDGFSFSYESRIIFKNYNEGNFKELPLMPQYANSLKLSE